MINDYRVNPVYKENLKANSKYFVGLLGISMSDLTRMLGYAHKKNAGSGVMSYVCSTNMSDRQYLACVAIAYIWYNGLRDEFKELASDELYRTFTTRRPTIKRYDKWMSVEALLDLKKTLE